MCLGRCSFHERGNPDKRSKWPKPLRPTPSRHTVAVQAVALRFPTWFLCKFFFLSAQLQKLVGEFFLIFFCRDILRGICREFCGFFRTYEIKAIFWDAAFCLQLEASCLQLSFFAYSCVWELFCSQFEVFYLQFELLCVQLSFFAYSGKVCLRSISADCKQRAQL